MYDQNFQQPNKQSPNYDHQNKKHLTQTKQFDLNSIKKKSRLPRRVHYKGYAKNNHYYHQSYYNGISRGTNTHYNQMRLNSNNNDQLKWKSDRRHHYDSLYGFSHTSRAESTNYLDTICQRRELIIDFDTVGWGGWVIAPQAYNARYCLGQCPFPLSTHYNTTNHAVLLQLVHLLDAAQIPGPCCVPNELSPQSLLYHSHNGDVVLKVYEDMVVESCACR